MAFRVLHVDDDALMRDVVESALLLDPSLEVLSCESGAEAVARAADWKPDLVLCDVLMPGMDGPATLAALREDPGTAKIPFVFMSGRAPQHEVERLLALGALAMITKPFDPQKLAPIVRSHLHSTKLTSKGGDFSERLKGDTAKLTMYRKEMQANPDSLMVPDGLRMCAHQLAGAAGIFGFPHISGAASALEDAIVERNASNDDLRAIKAKLDALLAAIEREAMQRPTDPTPAPRREERSAGQAAATPPAAQAPVKPTRKAPKMLIGDDDPAVLRTLAERCAKMGFQVDTASNGLQLLIKARQSQPDIMVVDINMPELDGLSVCTRFLDPGSKPVEVLVITGSTDPELAERCESMGLFYGRKGPDFWKDVEDALAEIYPEMADSIEDAAIEPGQEKVHDLPRVLVVDDDPDVERFLGSRLAKCGVRILYASDAVQAFQIAQRERPSAILSDCYMPNGDAQFLLHRLRSKPETASIPVIVMTGRKIDAGLEHKLTREVYGRPGAAQVVQKSFDVNELFGALQKYCAFEKGRG